MKHFQIKVCGITRPGDALLAARLGVDMLGFIFYNKSPRYISATAAKKIIEKIPSTIDRVGVFVDADLDTLLKTAGRLKLDYVQLHGKTTNSMIKKLKTSGLRVIQAFHIESKSDYKRAAASIADILQLDNSATDKPGGTGQRFDWNISPKPIIPNLMLSGGISADNVLEGIRIFSPIIVDVNSGVEISPGNKSEKKLKQFFSICNKIRYGTKSYKRA